MHTGAVSSSLEPLTRMRIRGGEERREGVNYQRRGVMHKIEKGGYDSLSSLSAAIVYSLYTVIQLQISQLTLMVRDHYIVSYF